MSTPLNGSVIKSFEILNLFSSERPELTAQDVIDALGMSQATAHRFLLTLQAAGALTSFKRGYYSLSNNIEKLGDLATRHNPLATQIQPLLKQTSSELGQSVMACRKTRQGPACMAVSNLDQGITVQIKVGTVLPFQSTAQGKLWLAHLPKNERSELLAITSFLQAASNSSPSPEISDDDFQQIKDQGYALNRGENEPDIGALSVPIFDKEGQMVLSVSVFGMLSRFDEAFIQTALPRLNQTAQLIQTTFLAR